MCGVQGEHRVAFRPNNTSSNNAIMSYADAPSKNQEDQRNYKHRNTKPARKGGTANPASQGTRQATTPGRARKQNHQNRLTNIFSSGRQNRPEEQENFIHGHQYRPAIDHQPPHHNRHSVRVRQPSGEAKSRNKSNCQATFSLSGTAQTPTSSNFTGCHPQAAKTNTYVQSRATGASHKQALQRVVSTYE